MRTVPAQDLSPVTTAGSADRLPSFEYVLYLALGASFHVLATPEIAGVQMRIAASDVVLGLALLLLTGRYFCRSIPAPGAPKGTYVWLGAMFSVLLWAYLRVGIYGDSSALWARIKVVGFVILSAYFVLGSWIASTAGNRGALLVARGFVAGAWISAVLGLLEYVAFFYFGYPIEWLPRPAALADNPNAYGIMLTAALALDLGTSQDSPLFAKRLRFAGMAVTLVAIFLSASRSAYLGLVLGLIAMTLFTRFNVRQVLRPAVAAVALFVGLFVVPPVLPGVVKSISTSVGISRADQNVASGKAPVTTMQNFAVSRDHVDHGFNTRLDLAGQAVGMWLERPILGAGLGAFWRAQQARNVPFPFVNHNTTLWVASEMGMLGLMVFIGGATIAAVTLIRHAGRVTLAGGVAGMLFVMFGASLGTEVMYQRYTWCFCGLALALVVGKISSHGTGDLRGCGRPTS